MAKNHSTNARQRANSAAQAVLSVWESGKLPALIAESVLASKTHAPCASWSLSNRILMFAQGSADARGYKQWQEAGRQVIKGSKAISILGPVFAKANKKKAESNTKGKPKPKQKPESKHEKDSLACIGFRAIPVFRFEDTEGDELESAEYAPDTLPPLQTVADSIGLKVAYCPALANFAGRYRADRKSIELCTHGESTWFHELAHAVDDHLGSMKRAKSKQDAAYRDGEVVAEFTAAALCKLYGIAYEANALKYIAHYRKDPAKAVTRLFSRIEKVLEFILETEAETDSKAETLTTSQAA